MNRATTSDISFPDAGQRAKDRAWFWRSQGLDGSAVGCTGREVLNRYGWCRSVASVTPYLAIHARAGHLPDQVNADCAATVMYELPSARGCTYVLPKEHFGIGLALAQGTIDEAPFQTANRFLGLQRSELELLIEAVLEALKDGPLTPAELKRPLGDKVRNFGEEGKKRGLTTSLPLALGWLQTHGKILRMPIGGELTTQTYAYRRWDDAPEIPSKEFAQSKLAELYFRWAGPTSMSNFQTFGGLTVKDTKAAMAGARIVELPDGRWISPDVLEAYERFQPVETGEVKFVGSMDNINMLRLNTNDLLEPSDMEIHVPREKSSDRVGGRKELPSHMIISDGRLIGVWEFDPASREILTQTWVDRGQAFHKAKNDAQAMVSQYLGDCRSFSLDSPASRQPRLAFIRSLNQA